MRYRRDDGNRRNSAAWSAARYFRLTKNGIRGSNATKEVRPIFVEEADEIVVVTVYTYYS
jgi:hypothetical protein